VDREVVEHDDIAGSQCGDQHLFDVGEETRTIDRPIEDRGGAQARQTQGQDHGVRLPVAAGRVVGDPQAARAPAVAPEEIRRHAALIEKDVLPHIAERLPLAPVAPLSGDVGASLFVGVYRFF
jgi:hypothetical protein